MKRISAVLLALILVLGALSNVYALSYTFTSLNCASTNGINNAGTIVGWYEDADLVPHGFSLSNGIYTTLAYSGYPWTVAQGINNSRTIIEEHNDGSSHYRGFV